MGNELCCQQTNQLELKQELLIHHDENSKISTSQKIIDLNEPIPKLSQSVKGTLIKIKPFEEQFQGQSEIRTKKFGNDIYQGPLDKIGRPTKIGKMYKHNGAYFVGNFVNGKAQGPCSYIMPDGSYFQGDMKDNMADCQKGFFKSSSIQYTGGFKNNQFNGQGTETSTQQNYSFHGNYQHGKKKKGTMQWGKTFNQYVYQGQFDENGCFTGKGQLTDPQGKYDGDFKDNQKNGYGIYNYNSKLRYQGFYVKNKKQGEGKLFNNDNTIAYKGIFKNGMPNGKGIATSKNGTQFETQWNDGIDVRLL